MFDTLTPVSDTQAVGQRVQAMGRARQRRVVVWDEVWDLLGKDAHPDTVVQLWRPWGGVNRTREARALSQAYIRQSRHIYDSQGTHKTVRHV